MKSVLVIGMGALGKHLARKVAEFGNEVLIMDENEDVIQELSQEFPNAIAGDCTSEGVLRSLGVNNFDYCFVTVGEDFYDTLEITAILKELGAKYVVTKAKKNRQADFLKKIGADAVFYPEEDMAESLAIKYTVDNIYDNFELTEEYSIYEMPILKEWRDKSISDIDLRELYGINIIAVRKGVQLLPTPKSNYVFEDGDMIFVIARKEDVLKISAKTSKKK
ncbi:MAG: TrkA family potassium uptake protein [Lachnospiraceae bacterium]|nr:TrkA family potassium uptake protein [Lachnospiraceae bacterium]